MVSGEDTSTRFRLWREDIRGSFLFLTRLPVGGPPPAMPRALRAFPIVGGVIGGLGSAALIGALALGLSPLASSIIALITMAALTGALHEDGLADTADGFGGGTGAEDKLRIMRDSRLGTYGAVALVFVLGLRAALLADLAAGHTTSALVLAVIAASAAGRLAPVIVLWALPPARADGLGQTAGRPDGTVLAVAGIVSAVIILPALWVIGIGSMATAFLLAAIILAAFCRLARGQIGGQTGDVAGAAAILTETGFLAGLAAG